MRGPFSGSPFSIPPAPFVRRARHFVRLPVNPLVHFQTRPVLRKAHVGLLFQSKTGNTTNRMKTHIIYWKSKHSGRAGTGTMLFEKEEAERLAQELNRDYPGIMHEAVPAMPEPALAASGNAC